MSWWKDTMKLVSKEKEFLGKWLELQDAVNCFLDASKASKVADRDYKGIKQILEKKEGLFRMKMMGKRVNYAARSVISPDPSLNTDEVGLPLFMAKKLTYP
jgi:DNA-directed RNA polymerase I subunit RPA1